MSAPDGPPGPGRTVWLASYPKSGNTWVRAIVTGLGIHPQLFSIDQLSSGAQPFSVGGALHAFGIDARWLDRAEIDRLRTALVTRAGTSGTDDPGPPLLRKTHEVHRTGAPGSEPFPLPATRAAILIVRDPRDVACSYAPFFGVDLDQAIDAIGDERGSERPSPARSTTAQPWGSWTTHARSWLGPDVPFPVHVIRYEDLRTDAARELGPVFRAIGLECTDDELELAVEQARFERLREREAERGFHEVSPATERFFRSGRAGGWRDELTDDQVAAIEADHEELMVEFGYELTTPPDRRARLRAARESHRRQRRSDPLRLPESLGIEVRQGPTPESLEDSERVRPWLELTQDRALVTFPGIGRILVEQGRSVTVTLDDDDPAGTPSWILQGWATTIASMQRGLLSLHAATLEVDHRTVSIAGRRRAGKSTTGMALRRRGHRLLVDDVTIIDPRPTPPVVIPFQRNVHLLRDAADAVGVDFDAMAKLAGGRPKAAFLDEAPPTDPRPLDLIVELSPSEHVGEVSSVEVLGAERAEVLRRHAARDGLAIRILGGPLLFEYVTKLADSVAVHRIVRPAGDWSLDEVADTIESLVRTLDRIEPAEPTG